MDNIPAALLLSILLIFTVSIASGGLLSNSSGYSTVCDPDCPTIEKQDITNIHYDQGNNKHSGVEMNFSDGYTGDISYRFSINSWGGSADSQSDRHMSILKLLDENGCEILTVGMHEWNKNIVVYDSGACSPGWQDYGPSNKETGLSAGTARDINLTWNNNQWEVNIDGWNYVNQNHNNPADKIMLGVSGVGWSKWGSTYGNYNLEELGPVGINLCDTRGPENECIPNREHSLSGQKVEINEEFTPTENAIFNSLNEESIIDVNNSARINGLWRGQFKINSYASTLAAGTTFLPENGRIIVN